MYFNVKQIVTGFNVGDRVHFDHFAGLDAVKRLIDLGAIELVTGSGSLDDLVDRRPRTMADLEEECQQLAEALATAQGTIDKLKAENDKLLVENLQLSEMLAAAQADKKKK